MTESVQSVYLDGIQQGEEGLLYDLAAHESLGRSVEVSPVRYGAAVVIGTNDNQARLPDEADVLGGGATSGARFLGISVREHVRELNTPLVSPVGDGERSYVDVSETCSIATQGRIWVKVENNVNKGEDVFYRHTAGAGGSVLGSFRNNADTATANQVTGAFFLTSAMAGGFAVVQL